MVVIPWYEDPQWYAIIISGLLAIGSIVTTIVLENRRHRIQSGAVWRPQFVVNPPAGRDGVRIVNVGAGSAWDVTFTAGWDPMGFRYPKVKQDFVPPETMVDIDSTDTAFMPLTPAELTRLRGIEPRALWVEVAWFDGRGKRRRRRLKF